MNMKIDAIEPAGAAFLPCPSCGGSQIETTMRTGTIVCQDCGLAESTRKEWNARAALAAPDREALVEVIEQGFQDARHMEEPRPHESIADALFARGLRLPTDTQPETLAWAVVGRDGVKPWSCSTTKKAAEICASIGGRVVRVSIRVVDDEPK